MYGYDTAPDCCPELGYCQALLKGLEQTVGLSDPQLKATPVGFMQALLDENNRRGVEIGQIDAGNGHGVQVRVKRLKRGLESETRTTPACEPAAVPLYDESCVTLSGYREIAVAVEWDELRRYCAEASQIAVFGEQNTAFMNDHLKKLMVKLNGLRRAINADLLATLLPNFGLNAVTASNAAKPLPLLDSTNYYAKIEQGLQELMFDMQYNEAYGAPFVVGHGLFSRFNTSAQMGCCNADGFNWAQPAGAAPYRFFVDLQIDSLVGQDELVVFSPGALQILTFNQYRGTFAGKHGTSEFATFPDPYLPGLSYDLQLKFNDCGPQRGYTAILGLHYGLYFVPFDAYDPSDRLSGVNGAFRYKATAV